MLRSRAHIRSLLAIAALVLLFFARLALTPLVIAYGDAFTYFYPYWHAAGAALRIGRFPLWNDLIFMGVPLMANGQVGLFYLPNVLLWLLAPDAPFAFTLSVLLHEVWAGLGVYALLRAALRMGRPAALAGAALFAVGGGLTTHVAQINQLQGMAWMPWLFLLLDLARRHPRRWGAPLAAGLALQFLTGHSQTFFITGVGLGIAALWWALRERRWTGPVVLAAGGLGAALLAMPQLAPMLELSSLSNRAGGLYINEVVSFSLHPFLLGRALLPNYSVALHGEFIGTVGVGGLVLAVLGAWYGRKRVAVQMWALLALVGLVLALGKWNQFYWQLGTLPGFNLFRVPPRWLAFWALGAAVLAAYAVQRLAEREISIWPVLLGGALVLALAGITFGAERAAELLVPGAEPPRPAELAGWLGALALALGMLFWARANPQRRRLLSGVFVSLALVELLLASRLMPYNRLTAPEAFGAPREAIEYIQAHWDGEGPPPRYLSVSLAHHALHDRGEIEAVHPGLSGEALEDLVVATKLKDVVAPNLGMAWGFAAADGFDGGILPTKAYMAFVAPLLGELPTDGRLRERLYAPPSAEWLDAMGIEYLIVNADTEPREGWRLVHAGDVHIYTRQAPPRARFDADGCEAEIVAYAPESVTISTQCAQAATLTLYDAYYPGWRAAVDGEAVEVRPRDGLFRAVEVPAGEHKVRMDYTPTSWPAALLVSALTAIGLFALQRSGWPKPGR